MMRFIFVMALLILTNSGWCQFFETSEEVSEENIYPPETYETETGNIQEEQDLLNPHTNSDVDEYAEEETVFYDLEDPAYVEE